MKSVEIYCTVGAVIGLLAAARLGAGSIPERNVVFVKTHTALEGIIVWATFFQNVI